MDPICNLYLAAMILVAPTAIKAIKAKFRAGRKNVRRVRTFAEVIDILDPLREWNIDFKPTLIPDRFYLPDCALWSLDEFFGVTSAEQRAKCRSLASGMPCSYLLKDRSIG